MGGSGARLGTGAGGRGQVSPTSTGGRLEHSAGGFYGETDSGYAVSIQDGGVSEINNYRYGSYRVYEVRTYDPRGIQVGETSYQPTSGKAQAKARSWLDKHK